LQAASWVEKHFFEQVVYQSFDLFALFGSELERGQHVRE
jgi:hypothetical protein